MEGGWWGTEVVRNVPRGVGTNLLEHRHMQTQFMVRKGCSLFALLEWDFRMEKRTEWKYNVHLFQLKPYL